MRSDIITARNSPAIPPPLLILGASARAAAQSALRAGLAPWAADRFADQDLQAIAPTRRLDPDGLEATADRFPAAPWIYAGPFENQPDAIDRLAARRPLWGIAGRSLRACRDPHQVLRALRAVGGLVPDLGVDPRRPPVGVPFLRKPLASAGGGGIVHWSDRAAPMSRPCYDQRQIVGRPLAALFVAGPGRAQLRGVTEQLLGTPEAPFAYRGSIGPVPLTAAQRAAIDHIGRTLSDAFGLVGLFGVDLVLDEQGPWAIEVNPRYTASVEVIERAFGLALLAEHRAACSGQALATARPTAQFVVGKEVIFADATRLAPALVPEPWRATLIDGGPAVADWPAPGERIPAGAPAFTAFAVAADLADCRRQLDEAVARWRDLLDAWPDERSREGGEDQPHRRREDQVREELRRGN